MLKHNDIITKLTEEQKVRILTGVGNISGTDMQLLGIPPLKAANMKDYCRDRYPHPVALARAWNTELWQSVALDKTVKMAEDNVNFAIAPGAKIKISPYRKEITEDPYLASVMSATCMKATVDAGIVTGASGYYVAEADSAWMDVSQNNRILNEYIISPYVKATEASGANVIVTDTRIPNEEYKNSCNYIQEAISGKVKFLVCESVGDEHTIDHINRGIICLQASANALSSAMTRYKKLKGLVEQGKEGANEQLEEEISSGKAISDANVDNALDKTLDFIFACSAGQSYAKIAAEADDELALNAVLESTVLLKNVKALLPLTSDKKVAIIGDIAFANTFDEKLAVSCKNGLESLGFNCLGVSRGYDISDINNEKYMQEALDLCNEADAVLYFCGSGYETEKIIHKTEKLTLPPNQLYFADRLTNLNRPVVAIVLSDHSPDIAFSKKFDGVILMPTEVKDSAAALVKILTGEYSPSGKLTNSLYFETEYTLPKVQAYMSNYGMKIGPLIGYRYYSTAEMGVGCSFGYGLSYAEFSYSDLTISGNQVSFAVKNVGKVRASEIAQVYIGKKESSVIRPSKELCGFVKIELEPLEEKRVTLEIEVPMVYYQDEYVTEKGAYAIYVGSSVLDIKLKGESSFEGMMLQSDKERLSDYLQTISNILDDNYTLEASYSFMKKSSKNMFIGVGALVLAISIAIFNITTHILSLFLGIISGILGVCALAFFIIEAVERNKEHEEERKNIDEANKAYFNDAEQIPVLSTEQMFKDNFDVVKEEKEADRSVTEHNIDFDHAKHINEKFRMSDAVAEFSAYTQERGFKLNSGVAENVMSSLITSRLMILTGLSSEEFNAFVCLLCEYFGCSPRMDVVNEFEKNGRSVFFNYDAQGYRKNKNIIQALQAAGIAHEKINFAAVDGISADNAEEWISPFMKYVRTPKKINDIAVFDDSGKNCGHTIGRNLWLVFKLAYGESVDTLPASVLKSAAIVDVAFTKVQAQHVTDTAHGFTSYQADFILNRECAKKEVPEEMWKKVDKFEKYAQHYSDYSIGNRLWLDFENHTLALLACNIDQTDALDAALSMRLLPSVVAALKDKLGREDKTVLQMVEFIFGEENVQYSKAFIASLANTSDKENEESSKQE